MAGPVTTVFIDILGFAQLVEQHEGSEGLLDSFLASGKSLYDLEEGVSHFTSGVPTPHPLEAVFSKFHRIIEVNIERSLRASRLTVIIFSDSAFVAFEHPEVAFDFAQTTMRNLVSLQVPTRMGIGAGTFRALRFRTDTGDRIGIHASHFLGTSVTRAHAAESCGYPGMRILLHPALAIPRDFESFICPAGPTSRPLKLNVTQQLAYLHPRHSRPYSGNKEDNWYALNGGIHYGVHHMRNRAPEAARFQYDETLSAIDIMRERMNLPAIEDFEP